MAAKPQVEREGAPIREIGVLGGLVLGLSAGWQVGQGGDLLDAALRGAGVWLAVTVIWLVGVGACERILASAASAAKDEREMSSGSGPDGANEGMVAANQATQ
jgi:hypothetical protein